MNGFRYTLTLQEPLLANSLGGEPNSAESLLYIPGGAVRGAFIQKFSDMPDAADETFRRLFLNGETRFLNAYPALEEKRCLPAPLTWQQKRKSEEKTVYRTAPKGIDTEGVKFDFWAWEDGILHYAEETWQVNLHTQRDAEHGRAIIVTDPDDPQQKNTLGTVYRYIALPAGTKLKGAVLTRDETDAETLQKPFGKKATILLGKARTAGYGAATLEIEDLKDWREFDAALVREDKQITLTLLSPAIVRDENGQCGLDITPALRAHFGDGVTAKPVSRRETLVAGFNRKWGLPLPQVAAIAAGSVFRVENVKAEQLRALEESGIGERRAEGFGRVAVNLNLPVDFIEPEESSAVCQPQPIGALAENDPLATLMLTRLLRRDLDQAVIRAARQAVTAKNADGTPIYRPGAVPNSQISRWRGILRDSIGKIGVGKGFDPIQRLKKFCEANKGKPGWKKMEKARIAPGGQSQRLTEWIESALENPATLDTLPELGKVFVRRLGPNSVKVEDFNVEYRLRLLDAVLAAISKEGAND